MIAPASRFFLLVILLSMPFYLLGATGLRMPGLPSLPASALMTFVPMIAALILVYRQRNAGAALALLKAAVDVDRQRGAGWLLIALLFMPLVCMFEFGVLRVTGSVVPLPQIAPGAALPLFTAFFIGAIGEEVGWQGYAYTSLRTRQGALRAALVTGTVWALWHIIPFIQLGRSPKWIFWHSLSAVALRVIIVWLFENARQSVLVAVLFHTMINVSWALFPIAGSYYDPFVTFAILAFAAGPIVALWGPATLAQFRQLGDATSRHHLTKETPRV